MARLLKRLKVSKNVRKDYAFKIMYKNYYGLGCKIRTFADIGRWFNVSRERTRQIVIRIDKMMANEIEQA